MTAIFLTSSPVTLRVQPLLTVLPSITTFKISNHWHTFMKRDACSLIPIISKKGLFQSRSDLTTNESAAFGIIYLLDVQNMQLNITHD